MGAGPSFISNSVVLPSAQSRVKRCNIPLLQATNKKSLDVEVVAVLHMEIGELQVPVWFDAVNELTVQKPVDTFFIVSYVPDIL